MWRKYGLNIKIGSAVSQGDLSIVNHLISTNPQWKEKCNGGYFLLRDAVERKQNEIAKLLMRNGANVNNKCQRPINTPLHFAVKNCDIEIVRMLIDRGANVNAKNADGFTPLHYATEITEMLNIAFLLLHHGADVNAKDNDDRTPLIFAIRNNNIAMVKELLQYGADINARSNCGIVVLCIENENGYTNYRVKLLLSKGVNKNGQNEMDESHFYIAFEERRLEIVKLLLAQGSSVQFTSAFWERYTPLHMACENGLKEMVELLLRNGADVNAVGECTFPLCTLQLDVQKKHHVSRWTLVLKDDDYVNFNTNSRTRLFRFMVQNTKTGKNLRLTVEREVNVAAKCISDHTALYLAIQERCTDIIEILLKNGADVNFRPKRGTTPLHFAAKEGTEEICKLLLKTGADIHVKDRLDFTALYVATVYAQKNVVQVLLEHGADVNSKTTVGNTPLHFAVYKRVEEICRLLLEKGADVNSQDKKGITALHLAILEKHKDIIHVLIQHGADVKLQTELGLTPLHLAARLGMPEMCKLLLENGADLNAGDASGFIALHEAAQFGHKDVVQFFLKSGVDVNSRSKTYMTPLHLAAEYGVDEMCWFLLETGADVHAKNECGYTSLHMAAQCGLVRIIDILLHSGADIHSIDRYGNTPLHFACMEENYSAVEALLQNGSDVTIVNRYGQTVYDVIETSKYTCTDDEDDFSDDSEPGSASYYEYNFVEQLVVKMQIAHLNTNKRNLMYSSITAGMNVRYLFENKCNKEVKRMKSTEITNTNITFCDVLTKRIDQIVAYARNEDFVRVLKLNKYKKQFPEYADMIESRFNKAMLRKMLLDKGENVLRFNHSRFNYLPQNCIDKILSNLSNRNLMSL